MKLKLLIILCMCNYSFESAFQDGPDPWHYKGDATPLEHENTDVPPDLKIPVPPLKTTHSGHSMSDFFFKRMLAIVLKGGQYKVNEDSSVDVSVQMRFDENHWSLLNQYVDPNVALSEEMFRRSVGYVESAIYKPSVTERIVMAWNDYIHNYLMEYKFEITMGLGILAVAVGMIWLWNHMSHRHLIIIVLIALYLYEVFISYKEAEQHEFDRYVAAINTCKWHFWSSTCEVPPPNPTTFLKYMNPLKIGARMFTTVISEPMITISGTVQTIIHGVTDGMWFPLNVIMNAVLTVSFTLILVVLLVMIVFTYILNIPFNLSFLCGLFSIGVNDTGKRSFPTVNKNQPPSIEGDRISGATLNRILELCSRAVTSAQVNSTNHAQIPLIQPLTQLQITNASNGQTTLKRSASAGRLQDYKSNSDFPAMNTNDMIRKRGNVRRMPDGSGDAF